MLTMARINAATVATTFFIAMFGMVFFVAKATAQDYPTPDLQEFRVGSHIVTQAAVITMPEYSYTGEVDASGLPSGLGRAEYRQGGYPGVYYGQFVAGKRHGVGQYVGGGVTYIGEWNNDAPRGNGIVFFANGDVYSGPHQRFVPDGWDGGMVYADGTMYRGPWSKGKYSSWGTLVTADGKAVSAWRSNGVADNLARKEEQAVTVSLYDLSSQNYSLSDRVGEWKYFSFLDEKARYLGKLRIKIDEMRRNGVLLSKAGRDEFIGLSGALWQTRIDIRRSTIVLPAPSGLSIDRHTQWARYRNMMILSSDRVCAYGILAISFTPSDASDYDFISILRNPSLPEETEDFVFVGE